MAFAEGKNFTSYKELTPTSARYIDTLRWKYRCSTLRIYIQHGRDISPLKPVCRYLLQGMTLDDYPVLILDKTTL